MFTGIIEEMGTVKTIRKSANSAILTIGATKVLEETKIGDSIAVNGICLTVTEIGSQFFKADVMHETLRRSSLNNLKTGSRVNLERAMAANGRFGGHIVSGHVDGVGAIWYTIKTAPTILKYIVEKGSITIDGISLTVAKVSNENFAISAIPHTVQVTILKDKKVGDVVNLENDIIGKYVERLISFGGGVVECHNQSLKNNESSDNKQTKSHSGITMEFLSKHGF